MVYSFSFFVSSKNLLTYRKWPIGVDCQATRPLELEEVYHGFYSVPSPANVHWQEPLWLLTLPRAIMALNIGFGWRWSKHVDVFFTLFFLLRKVFLRLLFKSKG